MSREFKKQSGENLIDFISRFRIERSKELLLSNNMSINDVSKAVGYENARTFTRNFVKYEGVTPSEFLKAK